MATVRFSEKEVEAALESSARSMGPFNLKKEQKEVIISLVQGSDVFLCLPTGYEKSLCFAMLPLVFDHLKGRKGSIALCVSP